MKAMFEWKPEYSVGIASIDGQQQNLLAIAR
jgi:hemerythrin